MPEVILIKHKNNTHSIKYPWEGITDNFFIKQWHYKSITEQQLEEVKRATTDKVESIISKLYNENNPPLVP